MRKTNKAAGRTMSVKSSPSDLAPRTAEWQAILEGLKRGGEALKPVFRAIKERFADGSLHVNDWIINDPEIPVWEREYERQYGEIMATVIAAVRHYGIDPELWMTAYFEACENNGWEPPGDLEDYLPWNFDNAHLIRMIVQQFV